MASEVTASEVTTSEVAASEVTASEVIKVKTINEVSILMVKMALLTDFELNGLRGQMASDRGQNFTYAS